MVAHKRIGLLVALLMAAALIFLGVAYAAPELLGSLTTAAYIPPYVTAMDSMSVLDVQIIATESDWASMLANAQAEEYIPATVIINGIKIENVGIRPKGNSSLSIVARDDTTDRYSFKIEFDHYVSGQTWLGLDKLALNNMQSDTSYMKEYISYDLMRTAGVATPAFAFSGISVNGEAWGFYLALETLEDSYAKRYFGSDHGKLYKPEAMGGGAVRVAMAFDGNAESAPRQIQGAVPQFTVPAEGQQPQQGGQRPQGQVPPQSGQMPANGDTAQPRENFAGRLGGMGGMDSGTTLLYTDDDIGSYSGIFDTAAFQISNADRHRLIAALKKLNAGEDLESTVDVEATLKYFAAHAVIVNLDSYISGMSHNYYLYEKNGQLTMLPWDFNLSFGGFQSGDASSVVNFPIDTPVSGVSLADRPILGKLLEVPEYMELYHSYLQTLMDDYFTSGLFAQTVEQLNALIAPYVEADPSAFYDYAAYQAAVVEFKKLGLLRAESILGQLDGSIPATTEGQRENPSALLDASTVNLNALGSMGGGAAVFVGREGNDGGFEMRPVGDDAMAFDMEAMGQVMEILQAAGDEPLTPEQQTTLDELGITAEQLEMLRSLPQDTFGGADGGNRPNGGGMVVMEQEGGFPQNSAANARTTGYSAESWIVLGGCTALMLLGLLFAVFFRRRRPV